MVYDAYIYRCTNFIVSAIASAKWLQSQIDCTMPCENECQHLLEIYVYAFFGMRSLHFIAENSFAIWFVCLCVFVHHHRLSWVKWFYFTFALLIARIAQQLNPRASPLKPIGKVGRVFFLFCRHMCIYNHNGVLLLQLCIVMFHTLWQKVFFIRFSMFVWWFFLWKKKRKKCKSNELKLGTHTSNKFKPFWFVFSPIRLRWCKKHVLLYLAAFSIFIPLFFFESNVTYNIRIEC